MTETSEPDEPEVLCTCVCGVVIGTDNEPVPGQEPNLSIDDLKYLGAAVVVAAKVHGLQTHQVIRDLVLHNEKYDLS